MNYQEKRRQERFFRQLKAKLSRDETGELETIEEETTIANISSGGAFIQTTQQLPMASKVNLEFCLAFEDLQKLKFILSLESLRSSAGKKVWVKASAIVIRIEETGVGVIFDTDYQLTPLQPV